MLVSKGDPSLLRAVSGKCTGVILTSKANR